MSPGYEMENSLYLTQPSHEDYDRLCSLDVLGLEETHRETKKQSTENLRSNLNVALRDGMRQG